jgi:lantibiotic modifying enzyme
MVQPIGFGLYNGTSGLAMFFAYLGAVSGKTVYTGLAREAVDAFHSQVRTRAVSSIGAFDGIGGAIYALSHLARLWNDQHLMSEVNDLVSRVISSIEKNRALDVGEGAAGCIAGLLSAHGASRRNAFLKAAVTCGEQIIRYWSPADTPLTGFAHGAAGISLALLELWRETGRQDFLEKAREVVQYERNLFSAEHGNWPDLRLDSTRTDSPGVSGYKSAWCHGAIGIGLARVRCQPASAS